MVGQILHNLSGTFLSFVCWVPCLTHSTLALRSLPRNIAPAAIVTMKVPGWKQLPALGFLPVPAPGIIWNHQPNTVPRPSFPESFCAMLHPMRTTTIHSGSQLEKPLERFSYISHSSYWANTSSVASPLLSRASVLDQVSSRYSWVTVYVGSAYRSTHL